MLTMTSLMTRIPKRDGVTMLKMKVMQVSENFVGVAIVQFFEMQIYLVSMN